MVQNILQEKMLLNPHKLVYIPLYTHSPLPRKQKGNGICIGLQKWSAESPSGLISRPCHETPGTAALCASCFQAAQERFEAAQGYSFPSALLPTYSQQENACSPAFIDTSTSLRASSSFTIKLPCA